MADLHAAIHAHFFEQDSFPWLLETSRASAIGAMRPFAGRGLFIVDFRSVVPNRSLAARWGVARWGRNLREREVQATLESERVDEMGFVEPTLPWRSSLMEAQLDRGASCRGRVVPFAAALIEPSPAILRRRHFLRGYSVPGCPERPLRLADLAEGRLRLERLCRNGAPGLSSPANAFAFLAGQESPSCAVLR